MKQFTEDPRKHPVPPEGSDERLYAPVNVVRWHLDDVDGIQDRRDRHFIRLWRRVDPDSYQHVREQPTLSRALNTLADAAETIRTCPGLSAVEREGLLRWLACLSETYQQPSGLRVPNGKRMRL